MMSGIHLIMGVLLACPLELNGNSFSSTRIQKRDVLEYSFSSPGAGYHLQAHGLVIIYNVTNKQSFDRISNWNEYCGENKIRGSVYNTCFTLRVREMHYIYLTTLRHSIDIKRTIPSHSECSFLTPCDALNSFVQDTSS